MSINSSSRESAQKSGTSTLIALLSVVFFAQLLYLNIATLLPQFVEEHFPDLNSLEVGIMFAAYQIAFILCAPVVGDNLESMGRRSALFKGVGIMSLSTFVFGSAAFIKNMWGFYIISFIARLLQGSADAFILVTIPSILALEFPDKFEAYQGLTNMAMGIGLAFGPVVSTMLQIWFEYIAIEYFFALFILISGLTSVWMVPKRIDFERKKQQDEGDEIVDVPFSAYLKNRRVLMGLIAQVVAGTVICFFDPILTLRMEDIGVPPQRAGLGFIALAGAFALTAPFMGCLAEVVDRRLMIQIAFVGVSIGLLLSSGFSENSIDCTYIGLALSGICIGATIIPMVPEIIAVMNEQLKEDIHSRQFLGTQVNRSTAGLTTKRETDLGTEGDVPILEEDMTTEGRESIAKPSKDIKNNIQDKGPALSEISFAVGSLIGPVLGGGLEDANGFKAACFAMSLICCLFGLFYFIIVFGLSCCIDQNKRGRYDSVSVKSMSFDH